jgi:hypothetical protein
MRDQFLLQASKMEIAAIPQQLGAVVFTPYIQWIATEQTQQLSENVGGSGRDGWWRDGGRAKKARTV